MTELLIRNRIKHHAQAAELAKGNDYTAYCHHRREMLLAQAELYKQRNGAPGTRAPSGARCRIRGE